MSNSGVDTKNLLLNQHTAARRPSFYDFKKDVSGVSRLEAVDKKKVPWRCSHVSGGIRHLEMWVN